MTKLASAFTAIAVAGTTLAIIGTTPSAKAQAAPGVPASELRIATVDSIKLDQSYLVLVKHREVIQAKKAQVDAKAAAMAEAAKPMADRVRELQAELNDPIADDAKRAKIAEYQSLLGQLQKKDQEIKKYASDEYNKLTSEGQGEKTALLTRVREVISVLCTERGINLVLEHSSLEGRAQVVWFSKPEMDITDDVLAILNAGESAPATPITPNGALTPPPASVPIPAVPIEP